ncbi:hypothetical protein [Cerasicoccus fimbriatus]|uniref:ParE family toxin-like protein n=1 Tax=Cerasicoccus fimbriatus TaxID=3014554 RepID=UPI003CCDB69A
MRTIQLTQSETRRLNYIIESVVSGSRHPATFKGKALQRMKNTVSVPLGRNKRILFERSENKYRFLQVVTHERYNQIIART